MRFNRKRMLIGGGYRMYYTPRGCRNHSPLSVGIWKDAALCGE